MNYQIFLDKFINFFKNNTNNPIYKIFLHILYIINYNNIKFNFILLIFFKFFIILFSIILPIFIIIYSFDYLSYIIKKHKTFSWTNKNNILNYHLNRYNILNNFYNIFNIFYLSSGIFIYILSSLLFCITYFFIKIKIPDLLNNNNKFDIFINVSFSFFISILFILIIFYIFNYQYYSKIYNYHSDINKILLNNFDKKYFNTYCTSSINGKCFIDDSNKPNFINFATYLTKNPDFNISSKLEPDFADENNEDKIEFNSILDKYIKTLITHQLIEFFYNKNNISYFKNIYFCTYFDTDNIDNDKLPNIFYCLNHNNSQPFKFFNDLESNYTDIFSELISQIDSMSSTEKVYYKEYAKQYIINEYTKKINEITNNIHNIKDINFNETYIILFIICVIIVYTILLFLI